MDYNHTMRVKIKAQMGRGTCTRMAIHKQGERQIGTCMRARKAPYRRKVICKESLSNDRQERDSIGSAKLEPHVFLREWAVRSLDQLRSGYGPSSSGGSYEELFANTPSSSSSQPAQPLDFTHDNDYNSITEQGKQNITGSVVYEALTLDMKGVTRKAYLKRRDLLRCYDIQPRDLRRVDPSLSDTSPCLSVKDNAILISLGGMRGIISANQAIVFEPESPYTKKFIEIVSPRLASSSGATNLENKIIKHRHVEDKELPFELECCEGSLMVLVGQLDFELASAEHRIAKLLQKLPSQVNTANLEELRRVKQLLVELESKTQQVQELLEEFLDDEDDIAGMNLSSQISKKEEESKKKKWSKKKPELDLKQKEASINEDFIAIAVDDTEIEQILDEADKEVEEVEDLIEYYLQRCDALHSESARLLVGMRDMEESISVVLSSRRFEVNRLELALSMGSFAASLGAMISGIFGMNLRSTLEHSIAGFYTTSAGILILCFCVFWFLYRYTKRRRIL